jgi:hypothetical protein
MYAWKAEEGVRGLLVRCGDGDGVGEGDGGRVGGGKG